MCKEPWFGKEETGNNGFIVQMTGCFFGQ